MKSQFTSIALPIHFKIFLFNALTKLAMIARKSINSLLQRKLIGVPNYSRYHLMALTKGRNFTRETEFISTLEDSCYETGRFYWPRRANCSRALFRDFVSWPLFVVHCGCSRAFLWAFVMFIIQVPLGWILLHQIIDNGRGFASKALFWEFVAITWNQGSC